MSGLAHRRYEAVEALGAVDALAQEEARPPRKYYELTREGRDALAEARSRYRLLEQTQAPKTDKPKTSRA